MKAVSMLIIALVAIAARAQPQASQPSTGQAPADGEPKYTRTTRIPETLLGNRPRQVIILPTEPGNVGQDRAQRSSGAIAKLPADEHRLPEGYIVASREAQVQQQDNWYVMSLKPAEGLPDVPPLRVLPNQRLEMLETILAATDSPLTFVVTGRVTEFQGVNYLLIDNLAETTARDAKPPVAETGQPESATESVAADTEPQKSAPSREPTAEEIINHLMKQKPLRAVVIPKNAPQSDSKPPASAPTDTDKPPENMGLESQQWSEDDLLIDRVGRVVTGDQWWMLAFEDQGMDPKTRPIRLLPNQLLESAIALSGGGSQGVVFVVSGEITTYKKINHLLLRKVLVRRNLGNFR